KRRCKNTQKSLFAFPAACKKVGEVGVSDEEKTTKPERKWELVTKRKTPKNIHQKPTQNS
ncbi:568_t:CDS:2, partial [Gigaspora rosea]